MFSNQKSRLILIALSFVFAVTVYFQLQPVKANAGSVINPQQLESSPVNYPIPVSASHR